MSVFNHSLLSKSVVALLMIHLSIHSFGQGSTETTLKAVPDSLRFKFAPKATYISLNADSAKTIELPSGTVLDIDAGTFEKLDGTPVKGKVQIKYTEFRTAADFIGSNGGVTTITGDQGTFSHSSGMFEILGSQSGNAIRIKKNASIRVHFKPIDNPDNLNFSVYDSVTNKWTQRAVLKQGGNYTNPDVLDLEATLVKPENIRVVDDLINALKYLKANNNAIVLPNYVTLNKKRDENAATTKKWIEEQPKKVEYKKYQISVWQKHDEKVVIHIGEAVAGPPKKLTLDNLGHIAKKGTEVEKNIAFKTQGELAFLWEFDPRYVPKYSANTMGIIWDSCRFVEKDNGMQILFRNKALNLTIPFASPCILTKSGDAEVIPFGTYEALAREAQVKRGEDDRTKQSFQDEWNKLNLQILAIKVHNGSKLDTIVKNFQKLHPAYLKFVTGLETTKTNEEYLSWIGSLDIDSTVRYLTQWRSELGKDYYTIKNLQGKNASSNVSYLLPVSQFNLYNCDQTTGIPNRVVLVPEYETITGTKIQPTIVYQVFKDVNAVINVSSLNLSISTAKDTKLFIVGMDKNYYLVNSSEFKKYPSAQNNDKVVLKVEKVNPENNKQLSDLLKF